MERKGGGMNGCVTWLPEELIEKILLRLPATSLIRFRCVCKLWLSLISSNEFVRKHLNFNNSHHFNSVALISHKWNGISTSVVFSVSSSLQDEDQVTMPKLPEAIGRNNKGIHIWGHCDGLLLLLSRNSKGTKIITLWNPSINKYKTLPLPNELFGNTALGMGYDPSIDDYKVVWVSAVSEQHPTVDVLTLKTSKWRRVEFVLDNIEVLINKCDIVFSKGQFICDNNGGFFCACQDETSCESMLLRFDLAEEKFWVIPKPPNCIFNTLSLIRRWGSMGLPETLCLEYIGRYKRYHEVWIAKRETGWTWIKLFTIPTTLVHRGHQLLCFTRFGKVLFITEDDDFAIYDPGKKSVKKLAIHSLQQYPNFSDLVFPYIQSLVCP